MKKRLIATILLIVISVVGCGKVDTEKISKSTENKKEIAVEKDIKEGNDDVLQGADIVTETELTVENAEESIVATAPSESVQATEKKTETRKTTQKTETKKETVAPIVTTPVVTTHETKECEHCYQPEFNGYEVIEHYSFACNGCGYQLCTLQNCTDSNNETRIDAVNLPDLYSHPACETERFEGLCNGGGFHSHWFTNARCAFCHGNILKISCFFSETGKMCMKNEESLGTYEKIEDGQNPTVYLESCDCGKNSIFVGKVSEASPHSGLLFLKETCVYCGDVKTYPEK